MFLCVSYQPVGMGERVRMVWMVELVKLEIRLNWFDWLDWFHWLDWLKRWRWGT
jgi:hypothetical protein